ncbi:DNA-binding response regulator [Ammoniphilus oxalaticus]|uniref:DNA-binding response regulator n=1 Tax=Ammoniphilus oxalaticus TaxID=66863 RepID=A0A419SRG6_9BACL|nr:response regulator transcription factor [Ammoniphilus oxalaticus]RKD27110.1 DNA-binding response regulator [Ammoniphilus oxalaticus]
MFRKGGAWFTKKKAHRVLVIDDEAPMRKLLEVYLRDSLYDVLTASGGDQAVDMLKKGSFDLVLLDIMMPYKDGWAVCREIRSFSDIPIIMLTARDQTVDKVKGLKLGADDYITKPFEEMELLARIEALFRRSEPKGPTEPQSQSHGITIDPTTHSVFANGQPIELTPKEFELLYTFLTNKGRVYNRELLLEMIWDLDYEGDLRTVDTHVKNLREKLRKHGLDANSIIKTVWGVGYKGQ